MRKRIPAAHESRPRTAHRSRASSGRCLRTLRGLPGPISGQTVESGHIDPRFINFFGLLDRPMRVKLRAPSARARKFGPKFSLGRTRWRLRKLRAILAAKSAEVLFGCGSAWERLRLRKWSGPQNHTSPLGVSLGSEPDSVVLARFTVLSTTVHVPDMYGALLATVGCAH